MAKMCAIDWFTLQNGQFVRQVADSNGVFRSSAFPGLWLAANALIAGDHAQVEAVLRAGLAIPEHQAFVLQLAQSIAHE